jgi:hypothetical protein
MLIMNYNKTLALIPALLLAACSGDKQTINKPEAAPELYFAYPADTPVSANGQQQFTTAVPVSAPIFLRFTDIVTTPVDDIPGALTLTDSEGNTVPLGSPTLTPGDKGLAVKPLETLSPSRTYTLTSNGLEVAGETMPLTDDGIIFKTEPASRGPLLDQTEGVDFRVARFFPLDDDRYPFTDLSVPRIQFTEAVDTSTVIYGDTVSLRDSAGELVPAEIHVKGHRLTIDPDDYLDPAQTYSVDVTTGIESDLLSASLALPADGPWTFQPIDTRSPKGERQFAAQRTGENLGQVALSGEMFNTVNLSSKLLGPENPTKAAGVVFAELGYIPRFDLQGKSIPLAISRGSLMTGSSVVVNVAGAIPAGFESDNIDVRFISDANGFLMANPYTDADDAPRLVELYIDMALNTDNNVTNAALAQQIMHVQLVGTAIVQEGTLTIEAVGVIEPDVLGVENASGLISFRLEGFRFENDAPTPDQFADQDTPVIKSWVPGDNIENFRSGDPVIVYFSEPVLPSSVKPENIELMSNDGAVSGTVATKIKINGSVLSMEPEIPLQHGVDYTLQIDGITDIAGNLFSSRSLPFRLPETTETTPTDTGPIALTTLPGYPCAKTDMDLLANKQGRCLGGITSTTPNSANFGARVKDDLLPLDQHPADKPILVRFSQNIDKDSVIKGNSFRVEKLVDGSWIEVEGQDDFHLEIDGRDIVAKPFQSWEPSATYRYILTDAITNTEGVPLYSRLLNQYQDPGRQLNDLQAGGHNLENRFVATVAGQERLPLPLNNLPSRDVNSNLRIDRPSEAGGFQDIPANSGRLEITGVDSGVLGGARIGCPVNSATCERSREFIAKTAKLDVLVAPEAVESIDGTERVSVKLRPSVLLTSSSDVWIRLDNGFLATLATETGDPNQLLPTGPLLMRMRYQGENRDELIDGFISNVNGQLTFETELNIYLDAPYLNSRLSGLANTRLEDNLRSYKIDGLKLRGPVTFLEDGRMVIEQRNIEPINVAIELRGEATVSFLEECGIFQFFCNIVNGVTNVIIDVNTDLEMTIAADELHVRYLSPYTQ